MTSNVQKMALLHYRPPGATSLQNLFQKNKAEQAVAALEKLFPSAKPQAVPQKDKQNG